MEKIINLDHQIFILLNNLGNPKFDTFWLFITNQRNWTPFFIFLIFLTYRKLGGKKTFYLILTVSLLIFATDQTCNLFKNYFQRLRPCNTENLKAIIRIVKTSDTYSFFSGHAANSSAVAVFLFLVLKKHYKYFGAIFFWPLIFAYSRIYLGLHFPLDILTGYLFGTTFGILAVKLFDWILKNRLLNTQ